MIVKTNYLLENLERIKIRISSSQVNTQSLVVVGTSNKLIPRRTL